MRVRPALLSILFVACGPMEPGEDAYVDHDLGVLRQGLTVGQAGGCDTSIVAGLTGQLVDELNCIAPNTMVDFRGPNITLSGAVQPYLNPGAANAMKTAVAASGTNITLSSAYRSVAQQYLLLKWFNAGQCSIQAAAIPGKSNHQSGRAIDVPSYNFWISKLQATGWAWFGSGDLVHFDYLAAPNLGSSSVLAFQKLWNKNNGSKLDEDGQWGPMTEAAMAASPTTGFATFGCGPPPPPPPPATGTLKGKVYEVNPADPADLSKLIAGATVKVGGQTLTSDAAGLYTLELPAGTYTVTALATGFETASLSRMVTAGQTIWGSVGLNPIGMPDTQPPQLALSSPRDLAVLDVAQVTLAGTASDAMGTVASLTLSVNGGAPAAVQLVAGAFSQAVHLDPGMNTLRFEAKDDRGNGATLDVSLSFRSGVDGVVLSPAGSAAGATVTAEDAAGNIASATSAGDGTFHFDLLPGHYTLKAHAEGLALLEAPFDVGAERRESATLTLMPEAGAPPAEDDRRVRGGCESSPGALLLVCAAALLARRRSRSR